MKWILGTIALLLAGMVFKLSLLVYSMYVLLGIMGLSRFFTRTWITGLQATRLCNKAIVEIGDEAEVQVVIQNRSRLRIPWLLIEDSLPRAALVQIPLKLQAEGSRLNLVRFEPNAEESLSYRLRFLARGCYQLGPLLMETGDLFGLHRRFRVAAEPGFVLVLPKVLPLQGYDLASRRPIGEVRISHRLFEDPTRIAAVRPYLPGDPLNRIHWHATARTGQLHSRVYETSCVAGATLLLDFHTGNLLGDEAGALAELAITTAASLANAVYLMGQQVGLVSNGRDAADRIREEGWQADFTTRTVARNHARASGQSDRLRPVMVRTGKREGQLARILHTLARLEASDGMSFAQMVEETAPELPRDATMVAILTEVTPSVAVALGALAREGYAVTAVVVSWDMVASPDWARPPEWAELLLAERVDFRLVNSEEALVSLCANALVR